MDIQKMRQIASQFGLKSDVVENAIKIAQQNGIVKNGELEGSVETFKRIVEANGGPKTLQKGLSKLENPIIKTALKIAGIDVTKAKEAVNKVMNNNSTSTPISESDIFDRLKKLK